MLDENVYYRALYIRKFEEKLLDLYSQNKIHGTIHTSIGEEMSALAFAGQVRQSDYVFSNHRCHGHYIAFSNDHRGLMAEILGDSTGVCGGMGGSQHLCNGHFFSNGIQGGMLPVAAGMMMSRKADGEDDIGLVYIGDGTFGEGIVYETMNLISVYDIPLLIVCENNHYSQSTETGKVQACNYKQLADSFNIKTFEGTIYDTKVLFDTAKESIDYVRQNQKPAFFLADVYRLAPHSKGRDYRNPEEIEEHKKRDPLNVYFENHECEGIQFEKEIDREIQEIVSDIETNYSVSELNFESENDDTVRDFDKQLKEIKSTQVKLINKFFDETLEEGNTYVLGEDIVDPYGGSYRVTAGLSTKYKNKLIPCPISEASITGLSNGMALAGKKVYLEIMFGDFMTLALDQILNHAAKFYYMYNKKVHCPMVIRTPMGGGRGYGPTHSQSLERFFVGIHNVKAISLNTLINPQDIYSEIHKEKNPIIVFENKRDYTKQICVSSMKNYIYECTSHRYPIVRVRPALSKPDIQILCYGGCADICNFAIPDLFYKHDIKTEVIVLTQIYPLQENCIAEIIREDIPIYIVEEGTSFASIGSEVIALSVSKGKRINVKRISSENTAIASGKELEKQIVINKDKIISSIVKDYGYERS